MDSSNNIYYGLYIPENSAFFDDPDSWFEYDKSEDIFKKISGNR